MMRLCHLVLTFALPALALALPHPPESCSEEVSDTVDLLQLKKGGPGKPSSINRSTEPLLNRSTGAHDDIADWPTELKLSSLSALATRKLLPGKNITKMSLLHLLGKDMNNMPGDYGPTSIYAPLITVGAIGLLLILCAIAATVKNIRDPSIAENPMSVDELQAKRQQFMAMIKANVPRKPWGPPEPMSDAPGNTRSLAQSQRELTGEVRDHMHSQMWGRDHDQMQGQMHGQNLQTDQERKQMQQERRRDIIVHHPLEGNRLGINLTNDDLVITGIQDARGEHFGFSVGERVTHINGMPVERRADFVEALKAAMHSNKLAGYPVVVRVASQAAQASEPPSLPVYAAPRQADSDTVHAASWQPGALYQVPGLNPSEGQLGNAITTVPAGGSDHVFTVVLEKDNAWSPLGVDLGEYKEDVMVHGVTPGSIAAGRLLAGDVVVSINGIKATSHQMAGSLIAAAERTVSMSIKREVYHTGDAPQRYNTIFEEPTPVLTENHFQTMIPVFQQASQKPASPPVEPPPAQYQTQHALHQTVPVQQVPVFQQPGHVSLYETPPQTLSYHSASAVQQLPIYEAAPQASVKVSPPAGLSSPPHTLPTPPQTATGAIFPSEAPTLPPQAHPLTMPVATTAGHFDHLDKNQDDLASKAEFERGSQETQTAKARSDQKMEDLQRMSLDLFDRLDKNHDGEVNRAEFERGMQEIQAAMARPV